LQEIDKEWFVMGKMVFLKLSEAKWVERVGFNPIYECRGKFYVGLEPLRLGGEDTEYCEECESLQEAEAVCAKIHEWGNESDPLKETMVTE
jgi:hypothetical protein